MRVNAPEAKSRSYRRVGYQTNILPTTETKIMFRELKNPKEKLASGKKIDIRMVSALMMTKLCKDPGTPAFVISTADLIPSQATVANTLDSIPAEYHDFHNIF